MRYLRGLFIFFGIFFLWIGSAKADLGALSGYAWSENAGWINFNPSGGGVSLDNSTGEFKGYAWGENIGWLSFNCLDALSCATADYKVSIVSGFSMGCRSQASYLSNVPSCPVCSSTVDTAPPIINFINTSGIASKTATIKWNTNEASDSIVEFSADDSYGFIAGNPADISAPVSNHSVVLANLSSDTVYNFRIISRDAQGNISKSNSSNFKTSAPTSADLQNDSDKIKLAENILKELSSKGIATDKIIKGIIERVSAKPVILAEEAAVKNLTSYSASISWQTDKEASSLISFRLADNPQSKWREVGVTNDYTVDHLITLSDLTPGTRYEYQAESVDILGNIGKSKISVFTTKATAVVSEVVVSNITLSEAVVSWKTSVPVVSEIDYGLSAEYGFNSASKSKARLTEHEIKLAKLASGATYHFRVKGVDDNGSLIISDDYVFTTYTLPVILNYKVEDVSDSFAVLKWASNIETDSTVTFVNEKTSESRTQGDTKLAKDHMLKISSLDPGTSYVFKLEGVDILGNKAKGPEIKITTLMDKFSPVINFVRTYTTMMQNKERSQAVIAWKTDEPATSQVFLYSIANKSNPAHISAFDSNLTTNHTVVFTDLSPGVAYRFNIQSADKSGNSSLSGDFSMLMPSNKKSIIQMIVEVFEKMFGWTRKLKM